MIKDLKAKDKKNRVILNADSEKGSLAYRGISTQIPVSFSQRAWSLQDIGKMYLSYLGGGEGAKF